MAKPELILHIGTPKTGSTSLQRAFESNIGLLNSEGVYFPVPFSQATYGNILPLLVSREFIQIAKHSDNKDIEVCRRDTENLVSKMIAGFSKSNYKRMLISSENLYLNFIFREFFREYSDLMGSKEYTENLLEGFKALGNISRERINRIRQLFKDFDIKIVCYLRRQDLWIESAYGQMIKQLMWREFGEIRKHIGLNAHLHDFPFSLTEKSGFFNDVYILWFKRTQYYSNIRLWSDVFGSENIIIRPFEKEQFKRGLVKDFFADILKIEEDKLTEIDETRFNDRVSRDLLEYLVKYQPDCSAYKNAYMDITRKLNNADRYQNYFTYEERAQLINYHEAGNKRIAIEFLGREDGILFYEDIKTGQDDYPGLSEEAEELIENEFELASRKNKMKYRLYNGYGSIYLRKKAFAQQNFKIKGRHKIVYSIMIYSYAIVSFIAFIIKQALRKVKNVFIHSGNR